MGSLDDDENTTEISSSITLLGLLSDSAILFSLIQWLPVYAKFDLGATSKKFKELIYETPGVFRYLDLSPFKIAKFDVHSIDHGGNSWRNVQLDENLTEDE